MNPLGKEMAVPTMPGPARSDKLLLVLVITNFRAPFFREYKNILRVVIYKAAGVFVHPNVSPTLTEQRVHKIEFRLRCAESSTVCSQCVLHCGHSFRHRTAATLTI